MNYTYKNIWLITFPVMMNILVEQFINITDAIFLEHRGEIELSVAAVCYTLLLVWLLGYYFLLP